MSYDKRGLYVPRNIKRKVRLADTQKAKKVDWVNVFLFILLAVVIILSLVVVLDKR